MDKTQKELKARTDKWKEKLDERLSEPTPMIPEHIMENIKSYRKDADHFLDKGDFIRAFEAVVWAWAWLEIYDGMQ